MTSSRTRPAVVCVAAAVAAFVVAAPAQAAGGAAPGGRLPAATGSIAPTAWHTPGYEWTSTGTTAPGVSVYVGTVRTQGARPDWAVTVFAPATNSLTGQPTTSELGDSAWAQQTAERLRAAGDNPRVTEVDWPADYTAAPHGAQGWRVRAGEYPTQADAQTAADTLHAEGFPTATVQWTGYDPDTPTDGEQVHVAVVDPARFQGSVSATHGPVIAARTRTSELARQAAAAVAVNGGFFVTSDADGFQGVPSALAAYRGNLQAMSVGDRAALVLGGPGVARIQHLVSTVTAYSGGRSLAVDGLNRKPGLVRDCGHPGLTPTEQPRQDVTCTAADDVVLFTAQFGAPLPTGPGEQVVLDARSRVVSIGARGGSVPPGGAALQAIGTPAGELAGFARVGAPVHVQEAVRDDRTGKNVALSADRSIVSAAPTLVRDGRPAIDAFTEGAIDPSDRSFNFAWGEIRQPRTMAGVDAAGRLLLVTVDGREPGTSEGFTLDEEATFMRELGAVDALNLDGGGSTAMAVDGRLVNHPSDATGERAVGDAVVVVPGTSGRPVARR